MHLTLSIEGNKIEIQLKDKTRLIDHEDLTITHNLDTLLIRAIDKILSRNRIGKLSLRTLKIPTKLKDGTVSSMILKTAKAGLEV